LGIDNAIAATYLSMTNIAIWFVTDPSYRGFNGAPEHPIPPLAADHQVIDYKYKKTGAKLGT
jgi:hypothetical protein